MAVEEWKVKDGQFRNFFYGFKCAFVFACVCVYKYINENTSKVNIPI